MRYYFAFVLVISGLIVSCRDKPIEGEEAFVIPNHTLSKEVRVAADSVAKLERLPMEDGNVRTNKLLNISSVEDLVVLTEHSSANVRYIAFRGLAGKRYKNMRQVFYRHLKDSGVIVMSGGCIVMRNSVMNEMLRFFHPSNKEVKERFSKSEYSKYEKMARSLKIPDEPRNDNEKKIRELQSYDLAYATDYPFATSRLKDDFEKKRKFISKGKNIAFKKYDNFVLATAYFDIIPYHWHYPDVERKGDTIILKYKILEKHTYDFELRSIDKVVYVIWDNEEMPIKTVISE